MVKSEDSLPGFCPCPGMQSCKIVQNYGVTAFAMAKFEYSYQVLDRVFQGCIY